MVKDIALLSVSDLIEKGQVVCDSLNRMAVLERDLGCIDGKIIGTGQADYTQGSTGYDLSVDDNPFLLIDIPGIEGDERKYREIIKWSLSKAHVIFYVNGSGKKIEKDTLEKIKHYMHDGTSVYAIFNVHKKAKKNRIPGIDKTYREELSDAYKKNDVMMQTEKELKTFLDENFKGSVTLNGLLSFCSLAIDESGNTTIVNDPDKYLREDQAKFLKEYTDDVEAMRSDSHIREVQDVVTDKIAHFDEYILRENLKKLRSRLSDMISDITALKAKEKDKIKGFSQAYDTFERNCENARDAFVQAVGLIGRNVVEAAFIPVQEILFDEIERTEGKLKTDAVEMIFNQHKGQIASDIQTGINKRIDAAVKDYKDAVQEAENRLFKDMQRNQTEFAIAMGKDKLYFDSSFVKALKLSGKDWGKGALKVASYTYTGFNIGTVIPVLGNIVGAAIGFVVGLVMTIWGFFTSKESRINKAKEKLKNTIDAQIDKITDSLKVELKELKMEQKINQNHSEIQKSIAKQKKALKDIEGILNVVEVDLKESLAQI